jgi:SulP family sulfate permease
MKELFPFLLWLPKLKDRSILKRDLIAGMTVSFVLIPQSMAYAQLAWLPLQAGLYSAFIPVILASIFGYSATMITSSITIVSLMSATILFHFAIPGSPEYMIYASLLAFLSGVFYILLGYLRLGVLVNFLSHPVTIGFTNAAALLTISSQIPKLFWVAKVSASNYISEIFMLGQSIFWNTHFPTMLFWVWSLLVLIIGKRLLTPKIPLVLILLFFSIALSYYFWYNSVYNGKIIGEIPSSLPNIKIQALIQTFLHLQYDTLIELILFSILISMIGFAQTISVAKYLSYKTQNKFYPNRELFTQGIANIGSALTGGYNVAGSLSRSALNIRSGAVTGLSGIIAGCMIWITIVFFTQYLYYLPIATLWAIIIMAVYEMLQIHPIYAAWKIERHDAVVALITFITCIIFTPNLEVGILTWIILSLVLFIYRSMYPKIIELGYYKDGTYRDVALFGLKTSKDIGVYRFDGNLYFANAGHFESSILNFIADKKKLKYVILDFEWVNNIDSTAEKTIVSLTRQLKESDKNVIITWVRTRVFEKLMNSRFIKHFWGKYFYTNITEALDMIEEKYGDKIDTKPLRKYKPDKDREPELEKKLMKKIEKIGE